MVGNRKYQDFLDGELRDPVLADEDLTACLEPNDPNSEALLDALGLRLTVTSKDAG